MNAVDFLLQEHRKTEEKFREIEQADPQQRGALWRRLQPELKIHEQMEDNYLYGPLAQDPRLAGTELGTFQQRQNEDVRQLEQKMRQLDQLEPAGGDWLATFRQIRDALMGHVQEEETRILPKVPDAWDQARLDEAGRRMQEMKQAHTGQASRTTEPAQTGRTA